MLEKYLIHIDGSIKHQLYVLYLSHLLHSKHDEIEFNVITPNLNELNYMQLSPFEINVFQYEDSQIKSMPQAHKFAYNLHEVFNVDVFVDFMNTATSAFLGTAFKAKKRIGFYSRIRSLLLTESIKLEGFNEFYNAVLELLELELDVDQLKKDFEISGHDILILKTDVNREQIKELANHAEVYEVNSEETQLSEEIIGVLDKIQYVITDNVDTVGLFQYLNKIVVLPNADSIDPPINGVITIESLIADLSEEP